MKKIFCWYQLENGELVDWRTVHCDGCPGYIKTRNDIVAQWRMKYDDYLKLKAE